MNSSSTRTSWSRRFRVGIFLLLLAGTVGCDQTSKHIARLKLGHASIVALPGGLGELRLSENPGSFLSLGASLPPVPRFALFTAGVGMALAFLLVYLARSSSLNRFSFLGLALVCAGGISNLIDRLVHQGLVTDFVLLRAGPLHTGIFNAADLFIVTGLAILAFSLHRRPAQH
jgi:signal peptidase II